MKKIAVAILVFTLVACDQKPVTYPDSVAGLRMRTFDDCMHKFHINERTSEIVAECSKWSKEIVTETSAESSTKREATEAASQ